MSERLETLIEDAKGWSQSGKSTTEIVAELYSKGVSMMDSIRIVRCVLDISLGSAKELVVCHEAWKAKMEEAQPFYDELEEVADKIASESDHTDEV